MAKNSNDITRRSFCQGAAASVLGLFGIAALSIEPAAAQTKMSQASASYQDSPKGQQSCATCALFTPPDGCKMVEGTISPHGWCSVFTAKS